jgi:hypothetical protein
VGSFTRAQYRIAQLDAFSRRWPLAACAGVFLYVAAVDLIGGFAAAGVFFGSLTLLFFAGLAAVLNSGLATGRSSDDAGTAPGKTSGETPQALR